MPVNRERVQYCILERRHLAVTSRRHLRHLLNSYQKYCNEARTHLSLHKDAPIPRAVQTVGRTLAVPVLGGLHHQYFRAYVSDRHSAVALERRKLQCAVVRSLTERKSSAKRDGNDDKYRAEQGNGQTRRPRARPMHIPAKPCTNQEEQDDGNGIGRAEGHRYIANQQKRQSDWKRRQEDKEENGDRAAKVFRIWHHAVLSRRYGPNAFGQAVEVLGAEDALSAVG
jgi:hypothetical protein